MFAFRFFGWSILDAVGVRMVVRIILGSFGIFWAEECIGRLLGLFETEFFLVGDNEGFLDKVGLVGDVRVGFLL